MKKLIISLSILFLFFFSASTSFAHPGRTASDGCHYCRTNCDSWGVPWNERHCHGGYKSPSVSTPIQDCDDNIWTFLAIGDQKCRYGFWDFATGWGLVYGIGGAYIAYALFNKG